MSPDERQLLTSLFERIQTAASTPRDAAAEAVVADAVRAQPYAPYFLAQAVILQEQGLTAAAQRIEALEAQVRELQSAADHHPAAAETGFLGGLGSIFGAGTPQPARSSVPPTGNNRSAGQTGRLYDDYMPNAPPQQQPSSGPWGGGYQQQAAAPSASGGFLRGALGTAAGVAGGMMLADSLRGLFSPHVAGLGQGTQAPVVEETTINNYNDRDAQTDAHNDTSPEPTQADLVDDDTDQSFDDSGEIGDDSFDV